MGRDYYNKTVFEWTTTHLGSQGTVCAGGRYDGLVGQLKGKAVSPFRPLVCPWAWSVYCCCWNKSKTTRPYVIVKCSRWPIRQHKVKGWCWREQIRDQFEQAGSQIRLKVGSQGSMKSQMKKADQSGAIYALIFGEREAEAQQLAVKTLATAEQTTVAVTKIVPFIIEKFSSQ